jgi:uncharacterized protein with PhoU and TrkA domain
MRNAQEILRDFWKAMGTENLLTMMELIVEMKNTDPAYVDLMIASMMEEEDEDDEQTFHGIH